MSGTDQTVPGCIAKPERVSMVGIDYVKGADIEPMLKRALARRQVAVSDLVWTRDTLGASVGGIIVLIGGEG